MAYSELIKSFDRIRDYMRQFYVYGFKSREEYTEKSARSYDNERRRIESWLGEYMSFRKEPAGKNVFLSVDSRHIAHNPLHKAFRAKSFTDKDITLHFYLLDLLAEGERLSARQLSDAIHQQYLSRFDGDFSLDESTVRKKLKEYEALGLLEAEKQGKEVLYRRAADIPLDSWGEALSFFTEEDPMGVIGSFMLERAAGRDDLFRFKHHYMLHALDSAVLCQLLQGIDERRAVEVTGKSLRNGKPYQRTVCPLKIYVSTQSGRQYLLGYYYRGRKLLFLRLDAIVKVELGSEERQYEKYLGYQRRFNENLWGVSTGVEHSIDHIELTVRFEKGEEYIPQRLEREKRHGTVEIIGEALCRFTADVYDAYEMLPWLRTFIGRVVELKCSNPAVVKMFYEELAQLQAMYGGDADAVQ